MDNKSIYQLMPLVMRDLGAIPKSKKNREQNYKFRSVDDVLNALHPVLCQHGVSLSVKARNLKTETRVEQKAGGRGERAVCRSTLEMDVMFFAPDGSYICHTACGEGLDYGGDKATNKAMSAAFKYAMFLGLAIPVDASAVEDGDSESVEMPAGQVEEPKQLDTANPPTAENSTSVNLGALCSVTQVERIKQLTKDAGKDAEWLKGVIAKRNKSCLADLTVDDAVKLIARLEQLVTEHQAQIHF